MKMFFLLLGLLVLGVLGYELYRVYRALELMRPLAEKAVPYTQVGEGRRFLFAGDSIAFGVGADHPEDSLGGKLGAEMSTAHIDNISKNGSKIRDVVLQLQSLSDDASYETIVIVMGGNDMLMFTSLQDARSKTQEVFKIAKAKSGYVYLLTTGDLGTAPAFGPVLSSVFSHRSKEFRKMFMEEADSAGVIYVDLFDAQDGDLSVFESAKHHTVDGIHLSSSGYELWYQKLKSAMRN